MIKNKRALYDLIAEGYEREYDEAHYIQDTPQQTNPFFGPEVDFHQECECEDGECECEVEDETCPSCGYSSEECQCDDEDCSDDILGDISDKLDTLLDVILGDEEEDFEEEDDEEDSDEEDDEIEIEEVEDDEDEDEDDEEEDEDSEEDDEEEECR
jgi:hypothetical protein